VEAPVERAAHREHVHARLSQDEIKARTRSTSTPRGKRCAEPARKRRPAEGAPIV
jgi:hypothetical protein